MDTSTDLQTTVKDIWRTRPTRIPKNQGGNAMVAGVCEGIGARYQIDPVIARLAFVALTLAFGGGIFLYLLLWMNMPRFGMTTSPWRAINAPKAGLDPQEKQDRDTGWALLVGLVIFFPSLTVGTGGLAAASVVTIALAAIALYLLHRGLPVPPAGLSAAGAAADAPGAPDAVKVDTSQLSVPAGYPHPGVGQPTPPNWDPLGAVPELWYLPEPAAQPEAPAPKRHRWVIVLAVCGLTAATALAFAAVTGAIFFGAGAF